jgi:hypothetical protein
MSAGENAYRGVNTLDRGDLKCPNEGSLATTQTSDSQVLPIAHFLLNSCVPALPWEARRFEV